MSYRSVGFRDAARLISAAGRAQVPVFLYGSPGVGKTALIERIVGPDLGIPVITTIASQMDPSDVGLPYLVDGGRGGVERAIHPDILRACDERVIWFLDEINCANQSVRAALLRTVNERRIFGRALHPDTVVVLASNPSDQAPGATEATAAETNRRLILWFVPKVDEIRDYFAELGDAGSAQRALCADFAATLGVRPDLIQLDPPPDSVNNGAPFASPRAWDRAFATVAALTPDKQEPSLDDLEIVLQGTVGTALGLAYLGIRKLRKDLPTFDEILKNPETCPCPDDVTKQFALIGVVGRIAQTDPYAAACYTARLEPEAGLALVRDLELRLGRAGAQASPHKAKGLQAFAKIQTKAARVLRSK